MSLNREQRRLLKKKIGPIAKYVAELEKKLQDLKNELTPEQKQEYEDEIAKIMDSLTLMEMMAVEDLITSRGLIDKK